MKFVFVNYNYVSVFRHPDPWIKRISGYTGVLEALARRHTIISIEQINYEGEYELNGVTYYFPGFKKKKWAYDMQLNDKVKSLDPDVVLVHGLHFPLQVIFLRLRLGNKVRIIVQNHAEKPGRAYRKFLQWLADSSINHYLFTAKEMGMAWVKKGIIKKPAKINEVMEASSIFNPVDKQLAKNELGITSGQIFLWVGRLDANKDPLTVIKGFLQFAAMNPEARLYMIFHTEELIKPIRGLLDDADNRDAVVLVGNVLHDDMLYWYNAADYIISGSHYEGSGVAVCEAMSCGCIPVLTDILSFRKITDNGHCGILYKAGNEKKLLESLTQIVQRDIHKEREKVLHQFKKNLSFDAIAEKIQIVALST